jgi:hypothetical protein
MIPPVKPERLHLSGDSKEKMGAVLGAQDRGRELFGKAVALPKRAWGYVVETLPIEQVMEWIRGALGWVGGYARTLHLYAGTQGLIGGGMIAAGTSSGRSVLKHAVAPVAEVAFKPVEWGYKGVKGILNHCGGPGRWLVKGMEKAEAKVAAGFVKAGGWWTEKVAKHVAPAAPISSAVTAGGWFLVARQALRFVTPGSWNAWGIASVGAALVTNSLKRALEPTIKKLEGWADKMEDKRILRDAEDITKKAAKIKADAATAEAKMLKDAAAIKAADAQAAASTATVEEKEAASVADVIPPVVVAAEAVVAEAVVTVATSPVVAEPPAPIVETVVPVTVVTPDAEVQAKVPAPMVFSNEVPEDIRNAVKAGVITLEAAEALVINTTEEVPGELPITTSMEEMEAEDKIVLGASGVPKPPKKRTNAEKREAARAKEAARAEARAAWGRSQGTVEV